MERNLTEGSVFKNIITFSVPFFISYFLQTLYGLADLYFIGRFCETASTTAVSIGSQVMHMLTVMTVGLAMGSTVLIGNAVGAKDREMRNKAVGNTVVIFVLLSVIETVLLIFCTDCIVNLMSTPAEAVEGTKIYLTICFAGMPFIVMYNVTSSVLRGMGDSRSPMYFIAIACACNIILDYVLIGRYSLGPAGAAIATTASQALSVIVSVSFVAGKKMIDGLSLIHFRPVKSVMWQIIRVGLPISMQDGFIQISFLLITVFANHRGLVDSAAVGIVEKMISILFLVPSSLLSSVSALCAQNVGAGKHERAKKTMLYAMMVALGCGFFFAVLFQFIAPQAVSAFTKDSAVINAGTPYLRSYVWDCIFASVHFIFSGYFCAYGRSGISFIHNASSAAFVRIPLSYVFSKTGKTLFPMGCAAPAGSIVSIIICVIAFEIINRKPKEDKNILHG